MTIVFTSLVLVCLGIGMLIGYKLGVASLTRGTLPGVAARATFRAAKSDGASLARLAWGQAGKTAKVDGRAVSMSREWDALSADQREAVYRIAAASVVVLEQETQERVRRAADGSPS